MLKDMFLPIKKKKKSIPVRYLSWDQGGPCSNAGKGRKQRPRVGEAVSGGNIILKIILKI